MYVKGTVEETHQSYATQDVVEMRKPKLTVTVRPRTRACIFMKRELDDREGQIGIIKK